MSISIPAASYRKQVDDRRIYTIEGRDYPSVTTILDYIPKPGLSRWQAKEVAKAAASERERLAKMSEKEVIAYLLSVTDKQVDASAEKGSGIHAFAELLSKGDIAASYDMPIDQQGYAEQFEHWLYDYKPNILYSEAIVFSSEHGYAGTLDLFTHNYGVVDVKSGKNVWSEAALQMSAYGHSDRVILPTGEIIPFSECLQGRVLHLKEDSLEFRVVDIGNNTFQYFLSALDMYNWTNTESAFVLGGHHEPRE